MLCVLKPSNLGAVERQINIGLVPRREAGQGVDILFIASYTQARTLAYAWAKFYSANGVRTMPYILARTTYVG
jgi:hypothetical protein